LREEPARGGQPGEGFGKKKKGDSAARAAILSPPAGETDSETAKEQTAAMTLPPNLDTTSVLPATEDVDHFLSEVNEVSRLIEGLAKGTISPDYIDKKKELKELKERGDQLAKKNAAAHRALSAAGGKAPDAKCAPPAAPPPAPPRCVPIPKPHR
jgi:hypothetical protein